MALSEWNRPGSEEQTQTMRQVHVNRMNHQKTTGHCQKPGGKDRAE